MIIRQIFNNNVIRAEDQVGHEYVVIGNGLGFKKKPGQRVEEERIEKTFMLKPEKVPRKARSLLFISMPRISHSMALYIIRLLWYNYINYRI